MAKRLPKKTATKKSRTQKPLTEEQLGSVSGGGLGRAFTPVEPIKLTPVDPIRIPVDPIRIHAPGTNQSIPVEPIKQG